MSGARLWLFAQTLAPGNERVSEMALLSQIESATFPCEKVVILVIPGSRTDSSQSFTNNETNENIRRVYLLVEEYEIERLYSSLFFFLSFILAFCRSTKNNRSTKYSLLDKRVVDGKCFIVSTVSRNKLRFR